VDDLRESPAVEIVKELAEKHAARVLAVEPHIRALPASLSALGVESVSLGSALEQADVVALLVDHRAFASVDREVLLRKVVIDTRGLWQ